jgi:lipid-A-disaccharide synthase
VTPLVYLIAGEPSGDVLGAGLMAALKKQTDGNIRFVGIGGPQMEAEGLSSLFPMGELSVMGIAEILPHLFHFLGRIRETVDHVISQNPSVLVTIDSPGFSFRVAKKLKGCGIPLVHYVAPSVWAWRPGRAAKVAGFLDHLLALLPFEPPYFEREGLPCTFVGHPVVESGLDKGDGKEFRNRHGISEDALLIAVLPGSRKTEIDHLLPVFGPCLASLQESRPSLRVVIPVVETLTQTIVKKTAKWPVPVLLLEGGNEKADAFAAADIALAASGTVSLELAVAGTPNVIAYKTSFLTALVVRRLVQTPYANLINIILKRLAVPEMIQEDCRSDLLAEQIEILLGDKEKRLQQVADAKTAVHRLGMEGPLPSERAAKAVLEVLVNR